MKQNCGKKWDGKFLFGIGCLIFVPLLLFECAPPAVKTTSLVPARFHEAAKLKEIAVLPFDGIGGKEFAAEVEATLASVNIDDKQYFVLVDRTKLDKILNEQALSQTGAIDDSTAIKVGKLVGAKGIYTGIVTARNSRDSHYNENRQRCVQRQIKYDKKGNASEGNCISWNRYTVPCTKRDAIFAFTPKLIDVQTGRITYSNNIVGNASSSGCQDSNTPVANSFALIDQAKTEVKNSFRKDVSPNYVTINVKLMESKEGIGSKPAEDKMDQAMNYAKNNRLDRACELWGEARILSPSFPSVLYNLGICAEVRGDLENALDLYKKADRALNKPDERITLAMARVSEASKKQKMLAEQLATINPPVVPTTSDIAQKPPGSVAQRVEAAPPIVPPSPSIMPPKEAHASLPPQTSPATASKSPSDKPTVIYLKTTTTCNVRSEPNAKSKIITTLKTGEQVEKLDEIGNWCNVKISSGKIGWIHKDLLKEVATQAKPEEPKKETQAGQIKVKCPKCTAVFTDDLGNRVAGSKELVKCPKCGAVFKVAENVIKK